MSNLHELSMSDLHDALARVSEPRATRRLTAAVAAKNGVPRVELAEWYDVERKTIYNWLERIEDGPLATAVADGERSGRTRKLAGADLERFRRCLREPPTAVGRDAAAWRPPLVQSFLRDEFDVHYSIPSCRRLMTEAGLRYVSAGERPDDGRSEGEGEDENPGVSEEVPVDDRGGVWKPA